MSSVVDQDVLNFPMSIGNILFRCITKPMWPRCVVCVCVWCELCVVCVHARTHTRACRDASVCICVMNTCMSFKGCSKFKFFKFQWGSLQKVCIHGNFVYVNSGSLERSWKFGSHCSIVNVDYQILFKLKSTKHALRIVSILVYIIFLTI